MSSETLKKIQQRRLAFLKAVSPITPEDPAIKEAKSKQLGELAKANLGFFHFLYKKPELATANGGSALAVTGRFPEFLLPPPIVPKIDDPVQEIQNWADDNHDEFEYAKGELEKATATPAEIDWKVSLHQLTTAFIVNFRDDSDQEKALRAVKSGDESAAINAFDSSEKYIVPAATVIGLRYIAFVDLAWTVINPDHGPNLKSRSGPLAGAFVSDGENPFIVLSFKGTTNELEGATDEYAVMSIQSNGILYNKGVHGGMYEGLFKKLPELDSTNAFDVILEGLKEVSADLGGTPENPVPLYVNGHSLGAGYAQLAYVELYRRVVDPATTGKPAVSFKLKDLYAFAAPRVGTRYNVLQQEGFPKKVKTLFEGKDNRIFRFANEHDVVPFVPGVVEIDNSPVYTYLHLDGGYILHRNKGPTYYKLWPSEIPNLTPIEDTTGHSHWEYHFPGEYYNSIKKIIDPTFKAPWPPAQLDYPNNGEL